MLGSAWLHEKLANPKVVYVPIFSYPHACKSHLTNSASLGRFCGFMSDSPHAFHGLRGLSSHSQPFMTNGMIVTFSSVLSFQGLTS